MKHKNIEYFNEILFKMRNKLARRTLLHFRDKSNYGYFINTSVAEIANAIGGDRSYVCRLLNDFEARGMISRVNVIENDGYLPSYIFFDFILDKHNFAIEGKRLTKEEYKRYRMRKHMQAISDPKYK